MNALNPTLWRTCRVLSGNTRISLMRALLSTPGQPITLLANEVGIGISDASQELRRLQSRGLLRAERKGPYVIYTPEPDPQVASAAPLLSALEMALKGPPQQDEGMIRIAAGLAHPRRIEIARILKHQSQPILALEQNLGYHRAVLNRHLKVLMDAGFIHRKGKILLFLPSSHPLSLALADLL
jgi:DNA-binding transcriptional ArsR family regulator